MPIFQIVANKFEFVDEKKIDLEKNIQILTEKNLQSVFNLTFVSGASNQEFSIRVNEQDFYIDTLAFDEDQKSFVIIEYKKDKSISVIDQGFAYLSAMLRYKADFILEINHRLKRNYLKHDINWDQSRVYFISPEFTNYQTNAVNFRDLPISLFEVKLYENNLISYTPIRAHRTSESINKLVKDETIKAVSKEVKVYEREDLVKSSWSDTSQLLDQFEAALLEAIPETRIKYTKQYIAYMSKHGRNYVEIVPQQQGLKVYFRFTIDEIDNKTSKLIDCTKVGHWTNGNCYYLLENQSDIDIVVMFAKESYKYLHKDIKK